MKIIKLAAATLNQVPLDWDGNVRNILDALEEARDQGATIVCLPELCITGYGCEDAFHSPHTYETAWQILESEIAPATKDLIVSVGLPVEYKHSYYTTACLLVDGAITGFVAKQFLAGDGIHYEPRWFKAWPADVVATLDRNGKSYPIGDIHFDCGGVKIGFEICEDAWVAQRPGSDLSLEGVDIILNPSASHFSFGKLEVRKRFVIEGSRAFGVTYVYSNLIGNEAGRAIYDGGAIIASGGNLVTIGPRFTFRPFDVTSASVDVTQTRLSRARTVSYRPVVETDETDVVRVPFEFPDIAPTFEEPWEPAPWEESDRLKEEEFTRAVTLGLFDYLRKSWSSGFVVSLSGGADSAAVASLAALMVWLGVKELGLNGFKATLSHVDGIGACNSPDDIVGRLLTCVYQATRNSSETTHDAARAVADAIGADFHLLDVDSLVTGYTSMVEAAIGRELTWETDDLALQNIQARTRLPAVWMFANIRRALLLATSNRSEAAVGYTTMDGDTAGGLSPIAGIDKDFLRRWLRWLETEGPLGHSPLPALRYVNAQSPTAELRPAEEAQTDEGDLMPYDLLDAIERAHIRDKRAPREVFRMMRAQFPQYGQMQLLEWTERFFKLWARNQWKRERYAPSFHLDDENLDPKTWCRFPILSGGYRRELTELRAWVEANESN